MAALAGLMYSQEFSDLKFTCRDQVYHVHKAVICCQSSVMKRAVTGQFIVGSAVKQTCM